MGAAMRFQPQGLLRINPNHPLAAGLVGFWLPNGGQFISAVPGLPAASLTSAAALASGPKGRVLKGDGSKVTGTIPNDSRYLPTSAVTVLVDGISANAGNQYWFTTEVSSNGFGMYAGGAHAYMRIGGGWADVGTGILAGEVCQGGMTYDGSTFWSIKNGKRANSMGASGAIVQAGSGITLGGTTTGGAGGGAWHYFAIWNRALSPAELASFYANPWQLFDAGSSSSAYQAAIASTGMATGGPKSFAYSALGGAVFGGSAAPARSTSRLPVGSLTMGGSGQAIRSAARTPQGGLAFSGTSNIMRSIARAAAGGLKFAGAAALSATAQVQARVITPVGGLLLAGAAAVSRATSRAVSGGIQFSGHAVKTAGAAGALLVSLLPIFRRRRR